MTVDRRAAKKELTRRRRESEGLREYIERRHSAPLPLHLTELVTRLETALTGQGGRLVIQMGPGFAKSSTCISAIAWALGKRPGLRVMYSSYAHRLAKHHARALKAEAITHAGVEVDPAARSAAEWRTTSDGLLLASSIGGSATGFRFNVVLVDDYCSSRADAESAAMRERSLDWHRSVARTRLEPGGVIIVCATPWHPEDLAAHCLAHGYDHVVCPALNAEGESTWPDRFSTEQLHEVREEIGEYDFAALYLCDPRSRTGAMFRDVQLIDAADLPLNLRIGAGVDLAYSERKSADSSVAVVMGLDRATRRVFVLDVLRKQVRPEVFFGQLADLAKRHGVQAFHWHASGTEKALVPFAHQHGVTIRALNATTDKLTRATPFSAAYNGGRVFVVRGPWNDAYVSELAAFGPGSRRDDQVDASASAYLSLHDSPSVARVQQPHPPKSNPWGYDRRTNPWGSEKKRGNYGW